MANQKFDLDKRLIAFSVMMIELSKNLNNTFEANHLGKQLIRAGTSAALNYGEAQSAESRRDFIHKIRLSLKELRECQMCLSIINEAQIYKSEEEIYNALKENSELIAIFVTSISTAQKNNV